MDWHLTWQDPVALALVVLVIVGSRWLKRRLEPVGCGACPHTGADGGSGGPSGPSGPVKPTRVPVERMRLHHSGRSITPR